MLRPDWNKPIAFPAFARWLILWISGAAACGLASAQSDTWWHLRAGQDIWRTHQVSLVDRYSYTAAGRYWPDHEWLWQFLAYGLHQLGGMPLLALVNGALAIGAVVLSLPNRTSRATIVPLLAAIPLLIGVWAIRPQVASLFVFALLLRLLRTERWWPIPLLMFIWANLHGAVATGGVVLIAATVAASFLAVRTRAAADLRRARSLTVVTGLSGLATLATPLGVRLWTYIVDSIGRSKSNHILEWESAFQVSFFAVAFWCWAVAILAIIVLRRRRISGWPIVSHVAMTLALLPFGISAIRNITFFVLAALPLVIALLDTGTAPRPHDDVPSGRRILAALGIVLAVGVAATYVVQPPRLGWTPMSQDAQEAIEACPGPMYTTYYGGGYLIWFTPSVKVFVDNRQDPYPSGIVDLGALVPGFHYQQDLEAFGVQCAALSKEDAQSRLVLAGDGWTTMFDDGSWSVLRAPGSVGR